jgi:hypothetical protein
MIECAVIRDLLPLYVDDVLSKESNALVDEHLASCEKCKQEFSKIRGGEIKVDIHNKDSVKIDALKSMKKKLLRKNVMVSLGSIAVFIVLILGVFNLVLLPQTSIPYEDGLLQVIENTAKVARDDNGFLMVITDPNSTITYYEVRGVLDIVSSRKTANRSSTNFYLEENGERIQLVFVNFTESMLSNWEPGGETAYAMRVVEPHNSIVLSESENGARVEWEAFDRTEIYYINQKISETNTGDYDKLRSDGTLIWSGKLD